MELLQPRTAETWAYYEHPYWGRYSAVTHQKYGRGSATYIGCFTSPLALQLIIQRICTLANISLPPYAFPLILKTGYNDEGNFIRYYFNYSSSPISFLYDGNTGTNLLSGESIQKGEEKKIAAWDLMIIEEKKE